MKNKLYVGIGILLIFLAFAKFFPDLYFNLGVLGLFTAMIYFVFGLVRRKSGRLKRSGLLALAALVIGMTGGMFGGGEEQPESSKAANLVTQTTTDKPSEEKTKASEEKAEKERLKKEAEDAEKRKAETKKKREVTYNELVNKEYSDTQTIDVNNGKPDFSEEELSLQNSAWEKYGDLDSLNRATTAEAMLHQSLMPTGKRGDISSVSPTGWQNKEIKDGYLYNRSHLIGWALSGENANWKNLITGTRQLNSPEMLRFEMDIKTFLEKDEDNYVRYRVTPVFRGDELLARGVHLEAQSVDSDELKFNVYIFNIQEGVTLNYADGSSEVSDDYKSAEEKAAIAEEVAKKKEAEEKSKAEKVAQEKAAAEKSEADRIAAEQAATQKAAEEQAQQEQVQEQATGQTVYIAPDSGAKYHFHPNCRGLSKANSVVEMNLNDAIAQGYGLCGWED